MFGRTKQREYRINILKERHQKLGKCIYDIDCMIKFGSIFESLKNAVYNSVLSQGRQAQVSWWCIFPDEKRNNMLQLISELHIQVEEHFASINMKEVELFIMKNYFEDVLDKFKRSEIALEKQLSEEQLSLENNQHYDFSSTIHMGLRRRSVLT